MAEFLNSKIGGRYEIRERIGAGGMARVFRAWDANLDRMVAVKILHEHLVDDESFKERFTREAKLVAGLNHPNIVQVFDYSFFERDGEPVYYMVMPYLEGQTLREVIDTHARQSKRIDREKALKIARQICRALGYAHERGMVHRDVKPGNVMLDEAERAILMDFGIARMIEAPRLTQDSATTGTPAYMSPEQAQGEAGDARSDLYSLGIMIFEMLAGRLPFTDEGGLTLVLKHLSAPIPTMREVTMMDEPQLDVFFQRALAKTADERFQDAGEFFIALQSLSSDVSADDTLLVSIPPRTSSLNTPTQLPIPTLSVATPTTYSRTIGLSLVGLVALGIVTLLLWNNAQVTPPQITSPTTPESSSLTADTQVSDIGFTTQFREGEDDLAFWQHGEEGAIERRFDFEDEVYRLTNRQTGAASTTLVMSDLPYGNVTITMLATLADDSAADAGYGIVFRYQDADNYNVFAVDGLGRYSIWTRQGGVWRELRGAEERWSPSETVAPQGEVNRLRININNEMLTGFINNQPIVRLEESTFFAGKVGIYLAAPEDGIAAITVDTYEVYPLVPSMTDPGQMG
jgi:serine/threonine protein kinase